MSKIKNKRESKNLGLNIILLVSAILVFSAVPILRRELGGFFEKFIYDDSFIVEILNMMLVVFIFIIGYLGHILIHELGHLLFGLLSGYEFVSFRIASFTLVRENLKFQLKRYNIPGTAGQCLMMPPEKREGAFPFIAFNLGGSTIKSNSVINNYRYCLNFKRIILGKVNLDPN